MTESRPGDDLFSLDGKVALITGSSRGLGLIFAHGLLRSGATVVLNGRDEARLETAAADLKAKARSDELPSDRIHTVAFDVIDEGAIARGVEGLLKRVGSIDVLVNNAGLQHRGPLETFPLSEWNSILQTNLTAAYLTAKAVVPGMIERHSGKIVNVCSLQSDLGRKSIAPYAASKGGLKMLTRAMAVEWAEHNIQTNAIAPGYFITDMTQPLADNPEFDSWLRGRTPAGRWGNPEELVGTIVYLSSAASSFLNGQTIYVDGGILASI